MRGGAAGLALRCLALLALAPRGHGRVRAAPSGPPPRRAEAQFLFDSALVALAAEGEASNIAEEVVLKLEAGGHIGLSTRGPNAFRVRFIMGEPGTAPPIDTPMVHPERRDAPFEYFSGNGEGITASFGAITLSPDGALVLWKGAVGDDVLAESERLSLPATSVAFQSTQAGYEMAPARVYGGGSSPKDAANLHRTLSEAAVCNTATYAPQYYHSNGYAALGVVDSRSGHRLPVSWAVDGAMVRWSFNTTGSFELYMIPAATLAEGTLRLYELVGAPLVPPRYALGFFASRWGWKNKAYAEGVVSQFRKGGFPLDSIIFDFEWFVNDTDYGFDPPGKSWYGDFGYHSKLFPHPTDDLETYHSEALGVRVGGIRKPRLGNAALLRTLGDKGWLLPDGALGGEWPPKKNESYAFKRNLDFTKPEVRDWYAEQMEPLVRDGLDFWWNDEGEIEYFTFHWWNVAEAQALHRVSPDRRFFSLNRAFSPGMARLGAAAWTGDIEASWEDMRTAAGMMLNWALSGMPYVGCDIGGFKGEGSRNLLVRWMQMGAVMPIMRVHSASWIKPHWPWAEGDTAANAIRKALQIRYNLVPYHYSLAHAMYAKKALWIRPLAMDFPDDGTAASTTQQWMDGDILVAPVMNEDSNSDVYLPAGTWYKLKSESVTEGPTNVQGQVDIDEIPMYVRAGTIITMAGAIDRTDALPGGPLEVQVYAGADCEFRLVEDDGGSTAYQDGHVRTTLFKWDEASGTLTWTVEGPLDLEMASDLPNAFVDVAVVVYDHVSGAILRLPAQVLGSSGSASAAELRPDQWRPHAETPLEAEPVALQADDAEPPVAVRRSLLTKRWPWEHEGGTPGDVSSLPGPWRIISVCAALAVAMGLTVVSSRMGSRLSPGHSEHSLLVSTD